MSRKLHSAFHHFSLNGANRTDVLLCLYNHAKSRDQWSVDHHEALLEPLTKERGFRFFALKTIQLQKFSSLISRAASSCFRFRGEYDFGAGLRKINVDLTYDQVSLTSYFLENLFFEENHFSLLKDLKALGVDIRPFRESHLFQLMTKQWGRAQGRLSWIERRRSTEILPRSHSVVLEQSREPKESAVLKRRAHSAPAAVTHDDGIAAMEDSQEAAWNQMTHR